MFAMYLDIQKGILIEELKEEEVKGRWKSFTGKWYVGIHYAEIDTQLLILQESG